MKSVCFCVALLMGFTSIKAQSTHISSVSPTKRSANLDRVFVGGNVSAGFSKYAGGFGISPIVGYNVNKYFDVGANISYTHSYNKDYYYESY